jgi:hypothetical protein
LVVLLKLFGCHDNDINHPHELSRHLSCGYTKSSPAAVEIALSRELLLQHQQRSENFPTVQ